MSAQEGLRLADLAALVAGRIIGDPETRITGFQGLDQAGPGDLTFAAGEKWRTAAKDSPAAALVLDAEIEGLATPQVIVGDANYAFALIVDHLVRDQARLPAGVHASAVIEDGAEVDPTAHIGPNAVIAAGAKVGARTTVHGLVHIGRGVTVGADCLLHPGVALRDGVRLGDRVIVHSNSVVGSDGFGFATGPDGKHAKVPQVGTVIIEDDVEIGACTTIDRARFDATRIGAGTKVDNLVMVAHNVQVGANSLLVAQCGIAGSTKLGKNAVLGGHVGVSGHLNIGDNVQVAAMSGVGDHLTPGAYFGIPALPLKDGRRVVMGQRRIPELLKKVRELERRLEELESEGSEA